MAHGKALSELEDSSLQSGKSIVSHLSLNEKALIELLAEHQGIVSMTAWGSILLLFFHEPAEIQVDARWQCVSLEPSPAAVTAVGKRRDYRYSISSSLNPETYT